MKKLHDVTNLSWSFHSLPRYNFPWKYYIVFFRLKNRHTLYSCVNIMFLTYWPKSTVNGSCIHLVTRSSRSTLELQNKFFILQNCKVQFFAACIENTSTQMEKNDMLAKNRWYILIIIENWTLANYSYCNGKILCYIT